jgi:hypothetical protein
MFTLRTTHAMLVASSALLAVALHSMDPVNVMLAVAAHFIVGQLVGQAMVQQGRGQPEPGRSWDDRR